MGQSNVPWEWDYQSALGMGLAYLLCKWDKPMCSENGTILCALGMGLANVHWEGDYQMCPGNGTSQCAK